MATPSTTPTSNPIPSTSIQDLLFNAELFDILINSQDDEEISSRLGVTLQTWLGISEQFKRLLIAGGTIYDDVATGRAAVDDGAYYFVVGSGANASRELWQRIDASTSEFISREISGESFTNSMRHIIDGSDNYQFDAIKWGVFGQDGQPFIYLNPEEGTVDGVFGNLPGSPALNGDAWTLATGGKAALSVRYDGATVVGGADAVDADYQMAWADEGGNVAFGIRHDGSMDAGTGVRGASAAYEFEFDGKTEIRAYGEYFGEKIIATATDGSVFAPSLGGGKVSYLTDANGRVSQESRNVLPDTGFSPMVESVEMWLSAGQSLDLGGGGQPAITLRPLSPGVVMCPRHGTRTEFSLVPTAAELSTVIASAANISESPIVVQSSLAWRKTVGDESLGIIAATYAKGGQFIVNLAKGTVPYNSGIASVAAMKSLCDDLGLPFKVPFISWRHGETDGDDGTSYADYKAALIQLQADYEADIQAITGQTESIPFVDDQYSSFKEDLPQVAFALFDVAMELPDKFYCAGPKYQYEYVDRYHLTSQSSAALGAKFAEASAAARLGDAWLPVHMLSATISGSTVTATFHCPNGTLVADTDLVDDPGFYGIRWHDNGDGNAVSITSATVNGDNTVTIELDAVPTGTGQQIGVADNRLGPAPDTNGNLRVLARSCLRDDTAIITDFNGVPVYHWACHQLIDVEA